MLVAIVPQILRADDVIRLEDQMSDAGFHRASACDAQAGGDCTSPMINWPPQRQRNMRIALARVGAGCPERETTLIDDAIYRAIAEINRADSNSVIRRVAPAEKADVNIFLLNIEQGSVLRGSRIRDMDGTFIEAAHVTAWYRQDTTQIYRSVIVIALGHRSHAYKSNVLEELFQSLGLLTDIVGAPYRTSTILADDSNMRLNLGNQDIAALKIHYPLLQ